MLSCSQWPYNLPDRSSPGIASAKSMKPTPTHAKLRGAYYTPAPIAKFLSDWAVRSRTDSILEPSLGDGAFVEAAIHKLIDLKAKPDQIDRQVCGFEIEEVELKQAVGRVRAIGVRGRNLRVGDFFSGCANGLGRTKFDVVLGNPPFIRYQNFLECHRVPAFELMRRSGLHPNRLTNAWVPFLAASSLLLKPNGRLGMVIPAELLQVSYAAELRLFLSTHFQRIEVITFRRLAFGEVQQEVVLLLAERSSGSNKGIEVVEFDSVNDLAQHSVETFGENGFKSVDHTTEKWTQYYLSNSEIGLIRRLKQSTQLTLLGDLADTDVGVVTGLNDFFVLTESGARLNRLEKTTKPLVSRSAHLEGTVFTKKDWLKNSMRGHAVHLLDFPAVEKKRLPLAIRNYIEGGEKQGLNRGYKCRIRKFWYVVPSTYVPDGFLLRQIHQFPKLIVNEANATSTDTIHRVSFKEGVRPREVATAFLNSLTFAFAELLGRSYGGGVLELEPSEADRLPIPLGGSEKIDFRETDNLVRKGRMQDVLKETDQALLRETMGLSGSDIRSLGQIWEKLRERRKGRRSPLAKETRAAEVPLEVGGHSLVPAEVSFLNPIGECFDTDR